jgi:hypothetical protein
VRLDCLTPRGRVWIAQQRKTAREIAARWNATLIETPDDTCAAIDALFARDGVLVGLAEIKCRTLSLDELKGFGDYLITAEKLERGIALAAACGVSFVLIVRLADAIGWWRVSDAAGRRCLAWQERETATRATCNGGTAVRRNAYLPLDAMTAVRL